MSCNFIEKGTADGGQKRKRTNLEGFFFLLLWGHTKIQKRGQKLFSLFITSSHKWIIIKRTGQPKLSISRRQQHQQKWPFQFEKLFLLTFPPLHDFHRFFFSYRARFTSAATLFPQISQFSPPASSRHKILSTFLTFYFPLTFSIQHQSLEHPIDFPPISDLRQKNWVVLAANRCHHSSSIQPLMVINNFLFSRHLGFFFSSIGSIEVGNRSLLL